MKLIEVRPSMARFGKPEKRLTGCCAAVPMASVHGSSARPAEVGAHPTSEATTSASSLLERFHLLPPDIVTSQVRCLSRDRGYSAGNGPIFFTDVTSQGRCQDRRDKRIHIMEDRTSSVSGPRLSAWPAPALRVLRGGAWNNTPQNLRLANRNNNGGVGIASTLPTDVPRLRSRQASTKAFRACHDDNRRGPR